LTGKYNDGNIPEGSRYAQDKHGASLDPIWSKYFSEDKKAQTLEKLNKLGAVAKEYGFTQAQLALAWAISNKDVSTCLLGFTRVEQVEENMKAINFYKKWNAEIEKKIEDILGNTPEPDMDFRQWKPMPSRRSQNLALH
jgi:aryl-alcohol dehydrogenase-like predicted oxidoreductase